MSGSSFERHDFESKLAEIGEMLGELWAIDELVRWVESNPEGGGAAQPNNGLYPRITVGERHPFEFEAPEGSWWPLLTSGRNWSSQVVESVRSLTWPMVRPESAHFEQAVDAIRGSVVDALRTGVADDFAHIDNNLGAWNGDAADAFGDWYAQLEFIARRQAYVAETVCTGIASCKAVVDVGQQSLMNLVDASVELLDEQLAGRAAKLGLPPENNLNTALLVGATLLGVLAAIPTGGASAVTTGAILVSAAATTSQVLALASSAVPADGGVEREISARTAEQFFHDFSSRIDEITDNVRQQWQGVEDKIEALRNDAADASAQDLLAPPRPSIVRRVTPDGFHHESAPR